MAFSTDGFNAPDDDPDKLPDPAVPDSSVPPPPDPDTQATSAGIYIPQQSPVRSNPGGLFKGVSKRMAGDLQRPSAAPLTGTRLLPNGQIVDYGQPAPTSFDPTATNTAPAASVAAVVPVAFTPAPSASAAPSTTTALTAGFDPDGGAGWRARQAALAVAPATSTTGSAGDIDPDSAVDLGLPASPATTSAAPAAGTAAPATPKPAAVPSSGIPAPAASSTSAGGTGVDPDLQAMLGGGDPDQDARNQYQRDHAADLKHFKSQGGITQVDATGAEQPVYDAQGGLAYKPTTISPVQQRPDGRFVRVDRTATGNYQDFDLLNEGADGVDYHTSNDGTQFVQVPAGNGQSRRVVIGQDNHVATSYALGQQIQSSQNDAEQASLAASQAQEGVAGADGLGALPLSSLRQQHTAALGGLTTAQNVIAQGDAFRQQGGTFTGPMLMQYRQALDTQDQIAPQVKTLQQEIDAREGAVTQAQQQHTASMGAVRDLAYVRSQIAAARNNDDAPLARNLQTVLGGQPIDPTQAKRYAAAGLLDTDQRDDGSTAFRLSEAGASLLPRDVQQQVQAVKTQRASQRVQQQLVSQHPALALPGSPESVAFLNAFRANGGDVAGAVQAVYGR